MTRSPEPDVERVLTKMGTDAFGYRNFSTATDAPSVPATASGGLAQPVAASIAGAEPARAAPAAGSAAAAFRLLADALPEGAAVSLASQSLPVGVIALPEPPPPELRPHPVVAAVHPAMRDAQVPPPPNPFPPRIQVPAWPARRPDSLETMFRTLSNPQDNPAPPDARAGAGAGFPFRRQ